MAERRDDRGRGPELMKDVLSRVLRESGLLDRKEQTELIRAWREVAGPRVAERTTVRSFRSGTLCVAVESAALRQELELFQREELLAALRVRLPEPFVSELRFTLE